MAKLDSCTPDYIQQAARNLVDIYPDDVEDILGNGLVHFGEFFKSFRGEKSGKIGFEQFMYNLIVETQLKVSLSNVEVVLRMYLVLMSSNCSAERSFLNLKLKIVKKQTTDYYIWLMNAFHVLEL